jgi:hypothetical protein
MPIKRRRTAAMLAATAAVISLIAAPVAAAGIGTDTGACTSQTDTNTNCQWPGSTSAQTDNTPAGPFQSQTPFNANAR